MLKKVTKLCIYGLALLTPIFFLPFTFEAFEFNKGYLLVILVSLGLLTWLGQMVFVEKKVKFFKSKINLLVLVFLLSVVLTTVFSKDTFVSIYGAYGRFWPSLIGFFSLAGAYFLLTNNVNEEGVKTSSLIKLFSISSLVVVLTSLASIFGLWRLIAKVIPMPAVMQSRNFVLVSSSLEALAIFLAFISVVMLALVAGGESKNKKLSIINYVLLFGSLALLLIINFWPAWLVIAISMIVFLTYALWKRVFKENVNRLTMPILFMVISIILLFINPLAGLLGQNNVTGNLPSEILLRQGASYRLGLNSIKSDPVFGSGLGNYMYSFAKNKPNTFLENNPLWYLRMDRSGNHLSEVMATGGIVGLVAWLILIIGFLWLALRNKQLLASNKLYLVVLSGFVALVVAQAVYYQNTVLAFSFFMMLALGALLMKGENKEREFDFKKFPEVGLVFSIIFWVAVVGVLFLIFNLTQYYLADVSYMRYLESQGQSLEPLEKAARLGDNRSIYHIALARGYLAEFFEEVARPDANSETIGDLVSLAITEIRKATELSPNQVAAQEVSGVIYREIQGLAQGAEEWAIKSFEAALELEPKNPALLTELGKLSIGQEDETRAIELFNQAVGLKSDFIDANLQIAFIDEKEGRIEEAKNRLEELVISNPYSTDARFQLGRLYYNQDELSNAEGQFALVLQLFPNHSNALYSLALIYERRNEITKALVALRSVLELNPGNQDVVDKIKALE